MGSKRKNRQISVLVIVLILFFALLIIINQMTHKEEVKVYQISYLGRQSNIEESQRSLKLGMNQAAKEYNVEIRHTSFEEDITANELLALVDKEIKNESQAIILEPINDDQTLKQLNTIAKDIPIVEISSNKDTKSEPGIAKIDANYQDIGERLGEIVALEYPKSRVYIVAGNQQFFDTNAMKNGVEKVLDAKEIIWSEVPYDRKKIAVELAHVFQQNKDEENVIVAIGVEPMEELAKIKKGRNIGEEIPLLGYGKSNPIISYIEEGDIDYTGVVDEYGMGYLGVQKSIALINHEKVNNETVQDTIINKNNIYTKENQRLLFPFVQ